MNHAIRRHRPSTLTASLLTAAVVLCGMAAPAAAQQNTGVNYVDAVFSRVNIEKQRRAPARLTYKVRKSSWRAMRNAGITPQLNLYLPEANSNRYRFAYSVKLDSRKGEFKYPRGVRLRGARTAEIQIVGFNGNAMVHRTHVRNESGRRIRIVVERPGRDGQVQPPQVTQPSQPPRPQPPRPRPNWKAEVIRECRAATKFDSEFNRCLKHGYALAPNVAAPIVQACAASTKFNSELQSCMKSATNLRVNPARVIRACKGATKFNSGFKRCLTKAAVYRKNDPSAVIAACGSGSRNGAVDACMDMAQTIRVRPARAVKACAQETKFDSELQGCIKRVRNTNFDTSRTISACGKATRHASGLNTCLERSVKMVGFDPAPTIEACGKATRFDSGFLGCLKEAQGFRYDPAASVQACSSARTDSGLQRCLRETRQAARNRPARRGRTL